MRQHAKFRENRRSEHTPTSVWRPRWLLGGDLVGISLRSLASKNKSPWAIVWRCLRDPTFTFDLTFSRFVQYRRVTDGRTDTRRQHTPR